MRVSKNMKLVLAALEENTFLTDGMIADFVLEGMPKPNVYRVLKKMHEHELVNHIFGLKDITMKSGHIRQQQMRVFFIPGTDPELIQAEADRYQRYDESLAHPNTDLSEFNRLGGNDGVIAGDHNYWGVTESERVFNECFGLEKLRAAVAELKSSATESS